MPLGPSPWRFDSPVIDNEAVAGGTDHSLPSRVPQVLTGLLPFPLRKNDHGVTVDILAGQKPSYCASMICVGVPDIHVSRLCGMMDDCWHKDPTSRPSMSSICQHLGKLINDP
jgi:hypothetical protein